MTKPKSSWTAKRLTLAEHLWKLGFKSRYVAEQVGVTRNAFIGVMHRKGWKQDPVVDSLPKPKPAAKGKPRTVKPKPVRAVPKPAVGKVRLIDLGIYSCRWPVSGTGAATLFCGRVDPQPVPPYCAEHRAKGTSHGYAPRIRIPG